MTLEEAIRKGLNEGKGDDPTDWVVATFTPLIAEAVREWASENAELYFGGYGGGGMPQYLAPSHYSVPLDTFGATEGESNDKR